VWKLSAVCGAVAAVILGAMFVTGQLQSSAPRVELPPQPLQGLAESKEVEEDSAASLPPIYQPRPKLDPLVQIESPTARRKTDVETVGRDNIVKQYQEAKTHLASTTTAMAPLVATATVTLEGDPHITPKPGTNSENPIAVNQYAFLDFNDIKPAELSATELWHYPRDQVIVIDGQSWAGKPFIMFQAQKPGQYMVAAIIHEPAGLTIVEYEVQVTGSGPPLPPPPPPLDGLAKKAYDWVMTEVQGEYHGLAAALAVSFDGIASRIAAGTLTDPAQIIKESTEANRLAIGDDGRNQWYQWFTMLRAYLNAESEAGRLTTPASHVTVWKDISKGLKAVQ
jgi:hypothetical protein